MNNQELIYQLTKSVYNRLGPSADAGLVEGIVTDVFRVVQPALKQDGAEVDSRASDRLIISVFGMDNPGIVAGVSAILAEFSCSIVDINQTVVSNKFAMVMVVNARNLRGDLGQLKERFQLEADRLGVRIYAQREDLFNAMHRI